MSVGTIGSQLGACAEAQHTAAVYYVRKSILVAYYHSSRLSFCG